MKMTILFCSSSRELRNKAEKMRRDRLNGLMEDMKSMVPIISTRLNHLTFKYVLYTYNPSSISTRKNKADKTRAAVLRVTANYLRLSQRKKCSSSSVHLIHLTPFFLFSFPPKHCRQFTLIRGYPEWSSVGRGITSSSGLYNSSRNLPLIYTSLVSWRILLHGVFCWQTIICLWKCWKVPWI